MRRIIVLVAVAMTWLEASKDAPTRPNLVSYHQRLDGLMPEKKTQ